MPIEFSASPVTVASEALGQLGRSPIQDLDNTDDPVCVQAKQYFGSLLQSMLRDHDWNFASEYAELAQDATPPLADFAFAYPLPADYVAVRAVNGNTRAVWKINGRRLFSDDGTMKIRYTRWVDIPNEWNGDFRQALTTYLAVRLAPALNVDKEKADILYRLYSLQLADAKATDGIEGSTEIIVCDDLTDAIRE